MLHSPFARSSMQEVFSSISLYRKTKHMKCFHPGTFEGKYGVKSVVFFCMIFGLLIFVQHAIRNVQFIKN